MRRVEERETSSAIYTFPVWVSIHEKLLMNRHDRNFPPNALHWLVGKSLVHSLVLLVALIASRTAFEHIRNDEQCSSQSEISANPKYQPVQKDALTLQNVAFPCSCRPNAPENISHAGSYTAPLPDVACATNL